MAGGDSHIRVNTSYGTIGLNSVIDAHSSSAGNMTQPISIAGRTVYVTAEAAARLRDFQEGGGAYRLSVQSDVRSKGFWPFKSTESNLPRGFAEEFQGNPSGEK